MLVCALDASFRHRVIWLHSPHIYIQICLPSIRIRLLLSTLPSWTGKLHWAIAIVRTAEFLTFPALYDNDAGAAATGTAEYTSASIEPKTCSSTPTSPLTGVCGRSHSQNRNGIHSHKHTRNVHTCIRLRGYRGQTPSVCTHKRTTARAGWTSSARTA